MTTLVNSATYREYLGTGTPDATSWFRGDGSWQTSGTFSSLSISGNTTLGDGSGDSVTVSGASWSWTAPSTRLQADFSNATIANRAAFQTSTTNGNTNVLFVPNGTGDTSQFFASNNSTPTNSSFLAFGVGLSGGTETRITSGIFGTGTYLPFTFYNGGSERCRWDTAGNVVVGTGQLANNATDGFLYIPGTTSGAPSGAPTAYSGRHPMVVDDTNNRLYINIGGTWRYATLT